MSIRDDKKFMELLGKYSFKLIDISELIDYIDQYVSFQINLEEFDSNITYYEEGLQKLPEWQKELNQRIAKLLEVKNDKE